MRLLPILLAGAVSAQDQLCFNNTFELRDAVDQYLENPAESTPVAQKYGWPIGNWCVRDIADFSYMFDSNRNIRAVTFNEDLTDWVTTGARDMSYMFAGATLFNANVSKFQTGRVLHMTGMFEDAASYNGDVSQWDVFNVVSFKRMFSAASSFAGDLSQWDMRCAQDISYMFYSAVSFNSDVSDWQVSKVQDFRFAFDDAEVFAQNLCPWSEHINVELKPEELIAMFTGTSCPVSDEARPVLDESQVGQPLTQLCFDCSLLEV